MKVITLNIPDSLEMGEKQLTMMIASRLYEEGKLSLGQAAEMAGLSKQAFADLLGGFNVSIFNFPTTDIANDVVNA